MPPDLLLENIPRLIVLAVLIAASGLISASETALFALTRQQLNRFRRSKNPAAAIILRLRDRPTDLLSTVLLANIAINILLYSMLGITAVRLAGDSALLATLLGIAGFVIVLFGAEIIPKLVAFTFSESLAPVVALPLGALEVATFPVRRLLLVALVDPLTRLLGGGAASPAVSADELQQLIDLSRREGLIDDGENVLLHQLVELSRLRVSALMIPRVDVVAFDLADEPNELLRLIKANRLLRIPVYEDNIDNIQGIVFAKEFLLHKDKPVRSLVRPTRFIPEQAGVEALLRHFRETGSQLALVVDEYGGLAGIVALEDVVETIVGELRGPEETADAPLTPIDETTYLVDAGMDVNDFCRAFELPLEQTRINTVAGLIAEKLDRLPETGDEIQIGPARLRVLGVRRKRVLRAKLVLERPPEENPDLAILLRNSAADRAVAGVRRSAVPEERKEP